MISFRNDYSEGAHPQVLAALEKNNLVTTCGYSMDDFCAEARGIVRARFSCPQADVHFMVGGTIANTTVIAAALRPWEGVIAADTGHINVHETGAIEASGHKICAIEAPSGSARSTRNQSFPRCTTSAGSMGCICSWTAHACPPRWSRRETIWLRRILQSTAMFSTSAARKTACCSAKRLSSRMTASSRISGI